MLAPSDIEAARARGVELIGAEVELKRSGRQWCGCCCFHAERTPSFYVYPDGHYHCFGCGAHGDAIAFAMRLRGLDFVAAVRWLLDMPDQPARHPKVQKPPETSAPRESETSTNRVRAILADCRPVVEGTPAWLYLWSRGLRPTPELLSRWLLWCEEVKAPLPALVAPIRGSDGIINAVQRIWVRDRVEYDGSNPQADGRADIKIRKKTLGAMGEGAVRLKPAGPVLGLAEGVESALAASQLYRVPCWAACGAARLGSIGIPPEVQRIIIFGDRGYAGEAAAAKAASIYAEQGRACSVILPPERFDDFNTFLRST